MWKSNGKSPKKRDAMALLQKCVKAMAARQRK
jgi:hypothetical protein